MIRSLLTWILRPKSMLRLTLYKLDTPERHRQYESAALCGGFIICLVAALVVAVRACV